jgi:HEAT repeat protein
MSTNNDVERILLTLKTDYPSLSARESVTFWNKTIDKLADLGNNAVMPLVMRLKDRDRAVRKAAVQALGRLADEQAVEPLIAVLQDRNHSVRRAAAEALGRLHFLRASEHLIRALHDEDAQVRTSAAYSLAWNGWQPEDAAHCALLIKTLLTVLQDKNSRARKQAIEALGKIRNPQAMNALLMALQNEDFSVRHAAARSVATWGEAALKPLIAFLKGMPFKGWAAVVYALGEIGDSRAVEPLLTVLRNGDQETHVNAIVALGKIRDIRAIEYLLPSLHDVDSRVRRVTVDALGNIGNPCVIKPLLSMLQDPIFSTRKRCVHILTELGWHPNDHKQQVLLVVAEGDWEQAVIKGGVAVEPLLTLVNDPEVAGNVVEALSTLLEEHGENIPTSDLQTIAMLSGLQYIRRPDDWGAEEEPLDCTHLNQRARDLLAKTRWTRVKTLLSFKKFKRLASRNRS